VLSFESHNDTLPKQNTFKLTSKFPKNKSRFDDNSTLLEAEEQYAMLILIK
jgi:hypothetical protein